MSYHTKIIFGKEQIRKYHNNENLTDLEKTINIKKFLFETREERNAFYNGISSAVGRFEFEVISEFEDKINKEEEDKFDYWAFIEKYYPNYYSCDSILLSDILTKKLHGEEMSKKDKKHIKGWNVRKELLELDKELLSIAFENYFNLAFPEKS